MHRPDAQRQLASLSLAIVLLDPERRIASVNASAENLFGRSLRKLAGQRLEDVIGFEEPLLQTRMGDAEAAVSARSTEVTLRGRGKGLRLDVTMTPVIEEPGWQILTLHEYGAGEGMGDEGTRRDDATLRAPAILAHEIKNPLAGIKGAAQLLARKLSGSDLSLAGLIADEVDRIAALIDQMQTLSQRTTAPVGPFNLHEAIRRASAVMRAGGSAPPIREEFDPSLPMVLGNADSLVQVVLNLLANSRDACAEVAEPRIMVRTRFASGLQLHPGATGVPVRLPIELRISDNGPGIDPQIRESVFEPFVTSKKTGQGLGLALVRRLVHDMNGRIAHDRDESEGLTHFRIHLPLSRERAGANRKETA